MNINNNFTPLAWHERNIELRSDKASYAFGHVVPLLASKYTLLPFQIIATTGAIDVNSCDIRLRKLDGSDAVGSNLSSRFGLIKETISNSGYDIIIYDGRALSTALPTGQYYLTLTSSGVTWYSDVLTIVSDVSHLTKITWYDIEDLMFGVGCIKYKYTSSGSTLQYKNWMYFLEEIGVPEYSVDEEGDTRDGLFYAIKMVSSKKYKMQIAQLTEVMCDALRFVHLSDFVEVTDGYGRVYNCDSVLVTPEWSVGGAVAHASIEITAETFVKQLGGGYITDQIHTGVIGQGIIGSTFVIGA